MFKYSDIRYASLTLDKRTEQFDIQNAILCQHIWELQTFKQQSGFLAHPVDWFASNSLLGRLGFCIGEVIG